MEISVVEFKIESNSLPTPGRVESEDREPSPMTRVNPKYPSPMYFPTTAGEGQRTQRSKVRQPSAYL